MLVWQLKHHSFLNTYFYTSGVMVSSPFLLNPDLL
jgi:hypothetical protein